MIFESRDDDEKECRDVYTAVMKLFQPYEPEKIAPAATPPATQPATAPAAANPFPETPDVILKPPEPRARTEAAIGDARCG